MSRRSTWNMVQFNLSPIAKSIDSDYIYSMSALAGKNRVLVYVEGWDDVAFWTNIFSQFSENTFDIMPPVRDDLSKGKKVVLSFAQNAGKNLLLAVDSDFDWLFDGITATSYQMKQCKWLVQTYAYSIENLQCEPSSLGFVISKSIKLPSNFDFVSFFHRYSTIIFPLFLWYIWSAFSSNSSVFPLRRFSNAVALYGLKNTKSISQVLSKTESLVKRVLKSLETEYPQFSSDVSAFKSFLTNKGVSEDSIVYYMQGHTFKDKVVLPLLQMLANEYSEAQLIAIKTSKAAPCVKDNQIDYFKNAIIPINYCLNDNFGYNKTPFYRKIINDISLMLDRK